MCKKSPGPRCAAHAREAVNEATAKIVTKKMLDAVVQEVEDAQEAFHAMDTQNRDDPDVLAAANRLAEAEQRLHDIRRTKALSEERLARALEEYDATETGREEIRESIARARSAKTREKLEDRLANAEALHAYRNTLLDIAYGETVHGKKIPAVSATRLQKISEDVSEIKKKSEELKETDFELDTEYRAAELEKLRQKKVRLRAQIDDLNTMKAYASLGVLATDEQKAQRAARVEEVRQRRKDVMSEHSWDPNDHDYGIDSRGAYLANTFDRQERLARQGGNEFTRVLVKDGRIVRAREGYNERFGSNYWMMLDEENSATGEFIGTSSSNNPKTQRDYMTRKGYSVGYALAPAYIYNNEIKIRGYNKPEGMALLTPDVTRIPSWALEIDPWKDADSPTK